MGRKGARPGPEKIDTKQAILKAAGNLFAECGNPGDVTVRDICAFAQVNPAMIKYYFGSKDGLIREVYQLSWEAESGMTVVTFLQTHRAMLANADLHGAFLDGLLESLWLWFNGGGESAWRSQLPLQIIQNPRGTPHNQAFTEHRYKPDVIAFIEIFRIISGRNEPDTAYGLFLGVLLPLAFRATRLSRIDDFSDTCRLSPDFDHIFLRFCKKNLRRELGIAETIEEERGEVEEMRKICCSGSGK